MINKTLCLFFIFCAFILYSCALMPRTVLDSDSGDIIESHTTVGKFKITIYPLDKKAAELNSKDKYHYLIGNHDQLVITVWGHPEFSSPAGLAFNGENTTLASGKTAQATLNLAPLRDPEAATSYTVDEDGDIYMPLLGQIKVERKTPRQVRGELVTKLSKYVVNPQVSVRLAAYRSKQIYVVGEINQPNAVYLNDVPLDLSSALSMSGWVNLNAADVKDIYVLRQAQGNNIDVYRLNATTPTALVVASGFALQPSDVVFVSTAGVAQFNRVANQFVSAVTVLWYAKTTVDPSGQVTLFPANNNNP